MLLTVITFITALAISSVAIYYSVAGLMTIFAAAAIPIMIMGGILEVSKLVTAVWLHRHWNDAVWWLKTYLTASVIVLMGITSMGIFGFLSKAHIEQTAGATSTEQIIVRIDDDLARLQETIVRAEEDMERAQTNTSDRTQDIQDQITLEQERIDSALSRAQPEIDRQLAIIEREQSSGLLEERLAELDQTAERLEDALSSNDVQTAQGVVGVNQDGVLGPNTRAAIQEFRSNQQEQRSELVSQIAELQAATNPRIEAAEQEVRRLQSLAEQEIANSNELINRLRAQLGQDNTASINRAVTEQEQIIETSRDRMADLRDEKFELETELRLLEVEVGPVKYIAEFVYGESDAEILEKAVRWVILIIIVVFDPLAVLLLIASQYSYNLHRSGIKKNL